LKRKLLLLSIIGMLVFSVCAAHAARNTLTVLGNNPFHKPPLATLEDLKTMVEEKASEIKTGFELAGQPELYDAFMAQFPDAKIEKIDFAKGETLQWMLYKRNGKGKVRVVRDVGWGSDEPFPAFELFIDKDGKRYNFVVPFACGNLSLRDVTDTPPEKAAVVPPPPPPPPAPNQEPVCQVQVAPERAFCDQPITVDASQSTDPDGNISSVAIAFIDDQGNVVSEKTIDAAPFSGEVLMPCGNNTMKLVVTDNDGGEGTCQASVVGIQRNRLVADAAYMYQFDPANYLLLRAGLEHRLSEQFSLLFMVGASPKLGGDDGASAFVLDFLANYSWSRVFASFGVGAWVTDGDEDNDAENSQMDLIADIGSRIYGEPEGFNISLFGEVRSGVDELNDIGKYGRFGVGLRFRF
jgi:hypothetical protein